MKTTQHEITARLLSLIISVFAGVILISLIAYTQNQDAKDDQAAKAHSRAMAK